MTHEPMDPQVVLLATVAATLVAGDAKHGIYPSAAVAKALEIITEASRKVAEGRTLNAAVDAKRTTDASNTVTLTRYTSSEWYGERGAAQVLAAIEDGTLWREKPTGILDSNVWTVTITAKRGGGA